MTKFQQDLAAAIDPAFTKWAEVPPYEHARWEGTKVHKPAVGNVLWSKDAPPPAIGAHVFVTMNDCGPAIVTGYFTLDGWLGICCRLECAPAWHKRQNKGDPNGTVFGPEFVELTNEERHDRIAKLVQRKRAAIEERVQTCGHGRRAAIQERIDRCAELIQALSN